MFDYIETPSSGEILLKEFMEPMGLTVDKLANNIDVPVSLLEEMVNGKKKMSDDMSKKLGTYFGVSGELFKNMQADIEKREKERNPVL